MSKRVVVLGNPVMDYVLEVERLPLLAGEHLEIRDLVVSAGGSANVLIAGARLGLSMLALGLVGDDRNGNTLLDWLQQEGIDTHLSVVSTDYTTTSVFILVAPDGSVSSLGHHVRQPDIWWPESWIDAIVHAAALHCDGWAQGALGSETVLAAARRAKAAGVPVFFDPGPRAPQLPPAWLDEMLRNVAVLSLTEDEARAITRADIGDVETLARTLRQRGPHWVVVKRGALGCVIYDGAKTVSRGGLKVPGRDSTGAGDAAGAAVVLAWLRGYDLATTAALVNAAGAAAVQQLGGGLQMPTADQIRSLLEAQGLTDIL